MVLLKSIPHNISLDRLSSHYSSLFPFSQPVRCDRRQRDNHLVEKNSSLILHFVQLVENLGSTSSKKPELYLRSSDNSRFEHDLLPFTFCSRQKKGNKQ